MVINFIFYILYFIFYKNGIFSIKLEKIEYNVIKIIIYIHFDKHFSYINIMELPKLPKYFEFLMKKRYTIPLYPKLELVLPEGIADDKDSPELTKNIKLHNENELKYIIQNSNNRILSIYDNR